jgi:hypothetical protein
MAFLSAVPQFGADLVVNRVLGVDKSLEVVRVAHRVLRKADAGERRFNRTPVCTIVTRRAFEKVPAWTEQAQRPIVSTASGFSTCPNSRRDRPATALRSRSNRRRCWASTPADVFGEWLGMSTVDVDQLRSDGVI